MSEKTASATTASSSYRTPSDATLKNAAKLAIMHDKPILLDYWVPSLERKAIIGAKNSDPREKMLVKSAEEYTSSIQKFFKVGSDVVDFIIITENSIYLVDGSIETKMVSN